MDDEGKYTMSTPEEAESWLRTILGVSGKVGSFLNEMFFEFHGRIKQLRINEFVEWFAQGVSELGTIDKSQIVNEKFADIFELVLIEVSRTSNEEKKRMFRQILLNELREPQEFDITEVYIQLISELTIVDMALLNNYFDSHNELMDKWQKITRYEQLFSHEFFKNTNKDRQKRLQTIYENLEMEAIRLSLANQNLDIDYTKRNKFSKASIDIEYRAKKYGINMLISKGLLKHFPLKGERPDVGAYLDVCLTEFSLMFLYYVKYNTNS